jgi:hypothetical protein
MEFILKKINDAFVWNNIEMHIWSRVHMLKGEVTI